MTKSAMKMTTLCLIVLSLSACTPTRSGLVPGTGYQSSQLPRAGAKLLIDNGFRRPVERIASNDEQCQKDAGCSK